MIYPGEGKGRAPLSTIPLYLYLFASTWIFYSDLWIICKNPGVLSLYFATFTKIPPESLCKTTARGRAAALPAPGDLTKNSKYFFSLRSPTPPASGWRTAGGRRP